MTTRIDARFAELKQEGRAAFITFLMAGDPDPATSLDIIKALPKAGADIIELGMPFSDPRSEEHTSELQSRLHLVCRLLLEKKKKIIKNICIDKKIKNK